MEQGTLPQRWSRTGVVIDGLLVLSAFVVGVWLCLPGAGAIDLIVVPQCVLAAGIGVVLRRAVWNGVKGVAAASWCWALDGVVGIWVLAVLWQVDELGLGFFLYFFGALGLEALLGIAGALILVRDGGPIRWDMAGHVVTAANTVFVLMWCVHWAGIF